MNRHRLAIRFDTLIRNKEVSGQAELARLGLVTRARMAQIMSLLNSAPDNQAEILDLPAIDSRPPVASSFGTLIRRRSSTASAFTRVSAGIFSVRSAGMPAWMPPNHSDRIRICLGKFAYPRR